MKDVLIKYKGKEISLECASCVDELSIDQFKSYIDFTSQVDSGKQDYRAALSNIFGLPSQVLKEITEHECIQLFNELELLSADISSAKSFYPTVPFFKAPKVALSNLLFMQFALADESLSMITEANSKKMARRVFAALYAPVFFGWSSLSADLALKLSFLIRPKKLLRIVEAYRSQSSWLRLKYKHSFGGKSSSGGFGYQGMVVSIAGDKFGSVDKARMQKLHDVFIHIEQTIIEGMKDE